MGLDLDIGMVDIGLGGAGLGIDYCDLVGYEGDYLVRRVFREI